MWAQAGEMKDSRDICDGESHGCNRVAWEDDLDGMTSSVDWQTRERSQKNARIWAFIRSCQQLQME